MVAFPILQTPPQAVEPSPMVAMKRSRLQELGVGEYATLDSPKRLAHDTSAWRNLPNPMGAANWFSLLTMLWMDPLIHLGAKRPLQEQDVWQLCPQDTAAHLNQTFQSHWGHEVRSQTHPNYTRALWRTLQFKTLWTTALYGFCSALSLLQPVVIKFLLEFLQASPFADNQPVHTPMGISSGYVLATLLTVLSFLSVTLQDYGQFLTSNLGVNAKSIVMDCVYLKTLQLSGGAKRAMSSGEIVTLSSVDSERVYQGYLGGPWVLMAPLTLVVLFVLVGIEMGPVVGLVGGMSMALVLYWGFISSKAVGEVRRQVLTVQAERVKLTSEALQGVRVVKLYAWESYLERRIDAIRSDELRLLRSYQYHRVLNTIVLSIAPVLSLALCLAVYVAQGYQLTTSVAFTTLAYMNVARMPCSVFSSSVMGVSEAVASCIRIGKFMSLNEVVLSVDPPLQTTPIEATVQMQRANFSWNIDPSGRQEASEIEGPMTLKDISLTIAPNTLTIVVGPVGSGKSSLISALLGEIHQISGSRLVNGRVAY
ncbi:hypothetical protein DYB36_014006, partial [Aphanomyces astaci]